VALSVARLENTVKSDSATKNVPWRYQAHCPSLLAQMRCPDFPPASSLARKSQRLSSPPAGLIITRYTDI
jgi:hypothetical protein